MSSMFSNCAALTTLDLGNFDTSAVTSMSNMFSNCAALTTLDLGNFDMSAVTSMSNMFSNCAALTTITGVISGMLAKIQRYADASYLVTQKHIAEVSKLTTVAEVEAYDITQGYPEKLSF
jgi:surface protein